ncbi:MAG: hypothetical protein OXN89_26305 [Bryobacterales bacterium]|nr:hypothetical protein [Bryobacterales bacterium]
MGFDIFGETQSVADPLMPDGGAEVVPRFGAGLSSTKTNPERQPRARGGRRLTPLRRIRRSGIGGKRTRTGRD